VKSIFVGNLSLNASENEIRSMFEGYGAVEYVSIARDRITGQPRGFGFVEMAGDVEGHRAMTELNGREVDGKAMTVNEARPQVVRGLRHSGEHNGR
jgi:RNA recognition motif-containing protein